MVLSYKDPVKSRAREKLRDYIEVHLLSHRSPKSIRVACFPGAEVEGEEALEVKEVYSPLGIPAENIVGIEYDKDSATRLRRADLGIRVVETDAYDFFKDSNEIFDVISLDYTGQRTWRERDITRFIAGKNLLNHSGVFSTNHLIKRESQSMKEQLLCGVVFQNATRHIFDNAPEGLIGDKLEQYYESQRQRFRDLYEESRDNIGEEGIFTLDKLRYYITAGNIVSLSGGRIEMDPRQHMFRKNKSIAESIQKTISTASPETFEKDAGIASKVRGYWIYKNGFEDALHIAQYFLIEKGFNESLTKRVLQILAIHSHNAYIPDNLERYSYISNKNGHMLFDILQVKKIPAKTVRLAKELIDVDSKGMIVVNPNNLGERKLTKIREQLDELYPKEKTLILPEPTYLGSSWQPPKRKEKISREEAIDLLKSGCSPAEIEKAYSGFTKMQLAAFKAHYVTMGKII